MNDRSRRRKAFITGFCQWADYVPRDIASAGTHSEQRIFTELGWDIANALDSRWSTRPTTGDARDSADEIGLTHE